MNEQPPEFPEKITCKVCKKHQAIRYYVESYMPPQSDEKRWLAYYECPSCKGRSRIGEREAKRVN